MIDGCFKVTIPGVNGKDWRQIFTQNMINKAIEEAALNIATQLH